MYRELPKSAISIANLRSMVSPSATLQMNAEIGAPKIDESRIPDAWLRLIGTNSVMIVGDEMGPAMSDDLKLVPFPATQTYSAYTPYLDTKCAERIRELKLPYLMVPANPRSFDSRNIYFDNPRLWTAVRRMYEYADSNAAFVLLRRRDSPIPSKNTEGVFDLQRSVGGKLTSLFLRTPRTQACFRFEDGSEYSCSANVEILDGMHVPDVLPVNPEDVPSFFGGKGKCPRVVDVRIAPANSFQLTGKLEYGRIDAF